MFQASCYLQVQIFLKISKVQNFKKKIKNKINNNNNNNKNLK